MAVYFIHDSEALAIKIGYTSNSYLEDRMTQLQIGNPRVLSLIAAWYFTAEDMRYPIKEKHERKLHRVLDHLRIRGEWFEAMGTLEYLLQSDLCITWKIDPVELVHRIKARSVAESELGVQDILITYESEIYQLKGRLRQAESEVSRLEAQVREVSLEAEGRIKALEKIIDIMMKM